ncbi:MAG: TIGR02391 family protein [Gemmatales bacterium]
MLQYEYRVKDLLEQLKASAIALRGKVESKAAAEDILTDTKSLRLVFDSIARALPPEVTQGNNFIRHTSWIVRNIERGHVPGIEGDISDICRIDIPSLEASFRKWCDNPMHFDQELANSVIDLLMVQQGDSAVRKAFVILKERLTKRFGASSSLDGPELVNAIFGSKGSASDRMEDNERQAFRDLLSGLYGVFRNKYSHQNVTPLWSEVDALIAMINCVLRDIDAIAKRPTKP